MSNNGNNKLSNAIRINIEKLITNGTLVIPEFQRPYEWDTERVEQFVKDLEEIFRNKKKDNDNFEYLIGNMVFYQNNNECQIVDGQQRIITLGIMFYVLGEKEDNHCCPK